MDEVILSVFYGEGKLGAASYHTATNKLGLFHDLPDGKPGYSVLCSLVQQTCPDYIVTSVRLGQQFLHCLEVSTSLIKKSNNLIN